MFVENIKFKVYKNTIHSSNDNFIIQKKKKKYKEI